MPNVDGTVVRLNIPPLTEERRKDIVQGRPQAHGRGPGRDPQPAPRGPRRAQARERDGEIGADDGRREQDHLQKLTDRWIDEVDRLGKVKEQEVLEV